MRKILIIGASVLQLPAILKAKEMGFYVGVVDYNPQAIGIKHADVFFNVSTIDTEGILETAKSFQPEGIMTLATDMPMRSIAAVTRKLNLPGISMESAVKATDKGEMIQAFKEYGVDVPWFFIVKNQDELEAVSEKITYPCIVKPVDNAGSRGVILINEQPELKDAYKYSKEHSQNGAVIIEEYMTGNEVSVEAMAVNGEIHILAITDKITTGPPHFVEMGHSQPSQLPETVQQKVKTLTVKAMQALGINNGPAHVEIMVTPNGPKMIELGARMGGDNITTHLVPLSTGIDMVKATIELAVGEIPDLTPKISRGSAIRYMKVQPGIIQKITGMEEAEKIAGVKEIVFTKSVGETATQIQSSTDRVGYVVVQSSNSENSITICELAKNKISIVTV
jgi:biotin carboxylase